MARRGFALKGPSLFSEDAEHRRAHAPGPDLPICALCKRPLAQSWGYGAYRGISEGLSACFGHREEVRAMAAEQKVRAE